MACKSRWFTLTLLAIGCGTAGVDEETPLVPVGAREAADVAEAGQAATTGPLAREVFSYGGGLRDPFESLLNQTSIGPELPDLTLVGVYVDLQNSA
ncbi:MAG: hypothetical protein E4G90_01820, partial [Gemmatimonadales bacterium]